MDNEVVASRFVPVAKESEHIRYEFPGWEVGRGEGAGDVGDDVRVGDGVVGSVLERRKKREGRDASRSARRVRELEKSRERETNLAVEQNLETFDDLVLQIDVELFPTTTKNEIGSESARLLSSPPLSPISSTRTHFVVL